MKKVIFIILPLIALIILVMLGRANWFFQNKQLTANAINTPLSINKNQVLQNLSKAIQLPTISYDDSDKVKVETFLQFHRHLQQSFPLVHQQLQKQVINQYSLIFHLPGSDPKLKPALFLAHMDVVPVDNNTLSKWTHPPFSGKIIDERVWGRGTMDDKSGVMALMEATELMLKQNHQPKRGLYLAFGHDEEVGGSEGAAKIAEYFGANNIQFEFVLDEGGAITNGMMQGIERPVALVGIAEKGFVNIHLNVDSDGGHSSQPPQHTAVGILSQAIVNIENNPFEPSLEFTELTFDAIGSEAAFGSRLAMANLWLTAPLVKKSLLAQPKLAASLHTTTAATMVQGSSKSNILPTRASGVINARVFPGQTYQSVKQRLETIIDDPRVKITTTMYSNPSPVSSIDSFGYQLIAQSIRDLDERTLVAPYLVQGGTDSKYFYGVSNNVFRFLMMQVTKDTLKRLHGIDEQIATSDYLDTIRFYHQMLTRI